MESSKLLFSTAPIPEQRPPRFDLRNRPKKNIDKSPKAPKVDVPDSDLQSADESDLFSEFLKNSDKESNPALDNREKVSPLQDKKPKNLNPNTNVVKNPNNYVTLSFNSNDWVFTQATAVASVNTTEDRNWQITSDTIKYVNQNGNAWETSHLLQTYKSFIGAKNLKDHIDTDQGGKIYGIILDAIPRKIPVSDKEHVIYIDTLIATNRWVDTAWADAIENGKIKFLSVGYRTEYLQCSKCSHIYKIDGEGICHHCLFDINKVYYDEIGRLSKISAMASDGGLGLGATKQGFIELSYLSVDPAFTGASQAFVLKAKPNTELKFQLDKRVMNRPALIEFKDQYKII